MRCSAHKKPDLGNKWDLWSRPLLPAQCSPSTRRTTTPSCTPIEKLQHEGQIGIEYVHLAHNNLSEKLSFQSAITLPPMSEPPFT